MKRQQAYRPQFESLESRRLLAQTPYAIVSSGKLCDTDIVHSQTPGVGYLTVGNGHCGGNSVSPSIFRTDGTSAGRYLLGPVDGADLVTRPLEVDGQIYFATDNIDAPSSGSFYRSDGTPNGTRAISSNSTTTAWEYKGDLYYLTSRYDSTTKQVNTEMRAVRDGRDQLIRQFGAVLQFVSPAGEVVLFNVGRPRIEHHTGPDGVEREQVWYDWDIWVTDGTPDGTKLWKQDAKLVPRTGPQRAYYHLTKPRAAGEPQRIYSTDGTAEGTYELTLGQGRYTWTTKFGDFYLIEPTESTGTRSLYATDGTTVNKLATLTKPARPYPGSRSSPFIPKFVVDDLLYFEADDRLWRTDGTREGTHAFQTFRSEIPIKYGWQGIRGLQVHATQQYVYFERADPPKLYRIARGSDTVTRLENEDFILRAGTDNFVVYQLAAEPSRDIILHDDASAPSTLADLGVTMHYQLAQLSDSSLLFAGESELEGAGYWVTDGTRLGTYKVSAPTGDMSVDFVSDFVQLGNSVLFNAIPQSQIMAFSLNGPDVISGDMDGDGTVDFADFLAFSAAFDALDDASVDHLAADINQDGDVDMRDFEILQYNYGKSTKTYDWPE